MPSSAAGQRSPGSASAWRWPPRRPQRLPSCPPPGPAWARRSCRRSRRSGRLCRPPFWEVSSIPATTPGWTSQACPRVPPVRCAAACSRAPRWRWPSCRGGRRRPAPQPAPWLPGVGQLAMGENQPMSALPEHAVPGPAGRPGLRERKKARTRAAIREHAFRLFREHGYDATTVEQIAASAEVSPSTCFRYFPTKEDVVLQDDMDTRMLDALERQPASLSPVPALRNSIREVYAHLSADEWTQEQQRHQLILTVPELHARILEEITSSL